MTTLFHSIESKHYEVSIFKQSSFVRYMIDTVKFNRVGFYFQCGTRFIYFVLLFVSEF